MSDDFLDPRLAERLARGARAAQALSETLWEALHEELADPRRQRVAELSARLGEVAATVASLAGAEAHAEEAPATTVEPEPRGVRGTDEEPRMTGEPATRKPPGFASPPAPREPAATREALSPAVLVDELAPDGPTEIEISDVRSERGRPAGRSGSDGGRPSDYGRTRS